jgi:hypothetical protein
MPRPTSTAAALLVTLLLGCTEPGLQEAPEESEVGDAIPEPAAAPQRDEEVLDALEALTLAVTAVREDLAAVMDASDADRARAAATAALDGLLADGTGTSGGLPLLPSTEIDRATSGGARDLLTGTLTVARASGGPLARATVDVLSDPIAGDLGSWERDPAGVIATVEATIAGSDDLDELDRAVLSLPGDATRALAWTLLASRAPGAAEARTYADRASAHLSIVLTALSQLQAEYGSVTDPPDADAGSDTERGDDADPTDEGTNP